MKDWTFEPARDLGLGLAQRLRSIGRENGLFESGVHLLFWTGVRAYLSLVHRLTLRGGEHLPHRPPFVLAANHSSHLDALALMASFSWPMRDRIFPIAAGDTFFESLPVAAFAAWALNALPVWRQQGTLEDLNDLRARLLGEPCAYIIFPEGTRSRTGEMARFRKGIGMLVAGADVPVIPCHLAGTYQALPPHQLLPVPRRITLTAGPQLHFGGVPNAVDGWSRIAGEVESAVRRLATPGGRS